jgi:hypothetical protein
MNAIRNFLNIPLRIIKLVVLLLSIVFVGIVFFLFFVLIDPLIWILTGRYKTPDERGDIIVDEANRILDKIYINTNNE